MPIDLVSKVQGILGETARATRWHDQIAIQGHAQARLELPDCGRDIAFLASGLAAIPQIHFDLEHWTEAAGGERYLFVPGLGLRRLELDAAGETLVRAGALELAVQESGSSQLELRGRLDILLGKPWLALLEPMQTADQSPRLAFLPGLTASG